MILLVSGATATMRRLPMAEGFGVFYTPASGNWRRPHGRSWAADNGCFTGFDRPRFERMLDTLAVADHPRGLFVTAPDVVGDHARTRRLFEEWEPRLRRYPWPVAFVLQDGATFRGVPWGQFDVAFIGGSTRFKLSPLAATLAGYAQAFGARVHVGRVNSRRRVRQFFGVADSYDGTCFSRFADRYIEAGLGWVTEAAREPKLW